MEVSEIFGMRFRSGSMAELNVRIFLCRFDQIIFMTETVGKNDIATVVGEFARFLIAFVTFGNSGNDNDLFVFKSEGFLRNFHCVDKVLIVSRVFVVQTDKTDFDVVGVVAAANEYCAERSHYGYNEQYCQYFFHFHFARTSI